MNSSDSDQMRLAVSMTEKRPKKDAIGDFMEHVDQAESHLPTMEELAGINTEEANLLS